jgi:hypothetical protein
MEGGPDMGHAYGSQEMHTQFYSRKMKERDHMGDLDVGGMLH